jgi:hypothetical protein
MAPTILLRRVIKTALFATNVGRGLTGAPPSKVHFLQHLYGEAY